MGGIMELNISGEIFNIISMSILVLSTLAGAYKYIRVKNVQKYETLLKVYSPLYQFIVRQELFKSYVHFKDKQYEDEILMDIHLETNGQKKDLADLSHNNFIEVRKSSDISIASVNLIDLINKFEAIIAVRDTNKHFTQLITCDFEQERKSIEKQLTEEIKKGYRKNSLLFHHSIFTRWIYRLRY